MGVLLKTPVLLGARPGLMVLALPSQHVCQVACFDGPLTLSLSQLFFRVHSGQALHSQAALNPAPGEASAPACLLPGAPRRQGSAGIRSSEQGRCQRTGLRDSDFGEPGT